MSSSRVSPRTPRTPREKTKRPSTREQKSPTNMKPSQDRAKRSEALIQEQVLLIKDTQNAIDRILQDIERESEQGDVDKQEEEELQVLLNKSQELLVMLQVLMKIRNELAYARLDLEKSIKSDYGVETAKKRVKWLQQRLEKVLGTTREYCQMTIKCNEENIKEKSNISTELWNRLTESQRQRYFGKEDDSQGYNKQSANAIEDFAKLVIEPSPVHGEKLDLILTKQLPESKKKRKKKRKSDRPLASSPPALKALFTTAVPDEDLYDGGGDSTPEPLSDEEADEGATESIISSIGPGYDLQAEEKMLNQQTMTPEILMITDSKTEEKREVSHSKQEDHDYDQDSKKDISEDKDVLDEEERDEYWDMDHHKFEWSDYMQTLDPRSWHALGIAVQESFISKEKPLFDSNLPWKEKPMKVNSVIDVHKIALDKLLVRLHRMYEAIGQATQATIDPVPKEEKVQTVMGKYEELETPFDGRPSTNAMVPADSGLLSRGVSRDVMLPPLPGTAATTKTVTFLPSPSQHTPSRYTRKRTDKFYPRGSKEWCEDYKSGHDMPKLVTFKPPPIHKKTSNVQSRYLGKKAEVKPLKVKESYDAFKRKDYDWKPQIVKSLIKIMKGMESSEAKKEREEDFVDYDGPKWRRLQELIGEEGLKSPNSTIAMEAARTIGQLNCRHPDILAALCSAISDSSNEARVCYEASKSLILLGMWAPEALKVVIKNIKKGNEQVVAELLYTMTKAKNIPFVDKSTPEFQSMVHILVELVKVNYHDLSFRAAVSLGRLCIVEPVSKSYLIDNLPHLTTEERAEALFVLIKQMNCKERPVLDTLFDQIKHAHNWKHRLEAADLLIFIGPRDLFNIIAPEKVFSILEPLLWDHANRELRYKIAETINSLGLRHAACSLVLSRLEDPSEDVRAKAVISMATLGMKGGREMKALLDLLELDSSVYVRIQVVRAFNNLKWNDPRILRSLRERERGETTLASEARKAISSLTNEGK
ncbi:uncharacterized protein LOC116301673 [Actinia tenebrosa]|uniref:Uncharacterized protein LOC116301673 n=1 Tax=Actinia tenebrosa TaxID=6105 RepID=A0A6P8IIP7_ACTTE|nr:uncharacterized protein LOC116301673 [Actinia tenebrosa]